MSEITSKMDETIRAAGKEADSDAPNLELLVTGIGAALTAIRELDARLDALESGK